MNELKHVKYVYPNGKQYCGDCLSTNVDGLLCHNCYDYPMIMKVKDGKKIHVYECDAGRNESYHIKTKDMIKRKTQTIQQTMNIIKREFGNLMKILFTKAKEKK
tara:strand:+ start:2848 stop:3159 length:312 start_codon:yes stop_codon:yes gene_type:complete